MGEAGLIALWILGVFATNERSLSMWDPFMSLLHWCHAEGDAAILKGAQESSSSQQ